MPCEVAFATSRTIMRIHPLTLTLTLALTAMLATSCESVRPADGNDMPVATWAAWSAAPAATAVAREETRDIVARVLRDAGLHPTLDSNGVRVPNTEAQRARNVLLTDKRLIGCEVLVLLPVRAGTCTQSKAGLIVPDGAAPLTSPGTATR